MENLYDLIIIPIGHKAITGKIFNESELIKLLEKYSASQWLDLFAKLEALIQISKIDITDPENPLNKTFFSKDIIKAIQSKKDRYTVLFSLGQLNTLRKLAIIYCKQNCATEEIPMEITHIANVLLAGQDLHNAYDENVGLKGELDNFCQFVVRNGYLNKHCDAPNLFTRTHKMFVKNAKTTSYSKEKTFHDLFLETIGMDVEDAMSLSFALANPFFGNFDSLLGEKSQTTIIEPNTYFQNLDIEQIAVQGIINSLTIDFSEAKKNLEKEKSTHDLKDIPFGYNLDLFKKSPLIRLENGKLACANVTMLLEKTTQNIIWQIKSKLQSDDTKKMKTLVQNLTSFRGKVFEEYVKLLCKTMAKNSQKLKFHYIPPESTSDHEEVGDSILVQGKKVMIIEAKSRQFTEEFKYTGDWNKDKQFMDELLKKASKQIEIAGNKLLKEDVKIGKKPLKIRRIYPVIITFEATPMHAKMQKFVREKVEEYKFLHDPIFAPLEIIDINDIEKSIDCVNTKTLIDLLETKQNQDSHSNETNFHNFFSTFIGNQKIISNGWQKAQFDKIWEEVFKKKLKFKKIVKKI